MITQEDKMQIALIKALGEHIGYGHLMSVASALWRKSLREKNYPAGAFVPTIIDFIDEEGRAAAQNSADNYDVMISNSGV